MGAAETYDVLWTPDRPGIYLLEVTTEFYPRLGGSAVQRVAFGAGAVPDTASCTAPCRCLRGREPVQTNGRLAYFGEDRLGFARELDGLVHRFGPAYRFDGDGSTHHRLDVEIQGEVVLRMERVRETDPAERP